MIRHPNEKRRTIRLLEILSRLLALSAGVYFFSYVTADPDLWGHLKFGKAHWHIHHFIRNDPYSFTAYGRGWINHEWLSELIFYGIYRHLGDAGLLLGKLGIGIGIIAVLTRLCRYRKRLPIVYAVVMIIAVSVISPGFMIRPQIFSFLFFALFFHIFYLYMEQEKNYLFLLPVFMIAWVNLHGGFLMGWVLMAVITLWKTFSRMVGMETGKGLRILWIFFFVTSLSTLVNPYGYKLLIFLYNSLSVQREISEWAPLPFWDRSMLGLKILILLFAGCLVKYFSKHQGWEIAGILLTLYAALSHQRHMPFFGIMATPYVIFGLSAFIPNLQARWSKLSLTDTSRYLLAAFMILQIGYFMVQGMGRYNDTGYRILVDPETYPVQAVRFMKSNTMTGNLLLPFEWGEYAIWKLYPACNVSIDGRFRTVYPETVINDHFIGDHDKQAWQTLLNKYPSDILLVRQIPFFQELIEDQSEWVYVFSDAIAIVFIRNSDKNLEMIERFRAGEFRYPDGPPSIYFP